MSISDSTQAGLRCGGKTGLAMAQVQREFMDNWDKLNLKFSGGIKKGELVCATANRLTSKSSFSDIFLGGELPDEYSSLRGGGKTCLGEDLLYRELFGRSLWEEPECILMKTSSKQPRHIRVWRNK